MQALLCGARPLQPPSVADVPLLHLTLEPLAGRTQPGVGNFQAVESNTTGISVGDQTTNPAIPGTIGASGTANDAPAYIVVNYIIKT